MNLISMMRAITTERDDCILPVFNSEINFGMGNYQFGVPSEGFFSG
jgi:hypothetical protein